MENILIIHFVQHWEGLLNVAPDYIAATEIALKDFNEEPNV
jgi:hypothetical protein